MQATNPQTIDGQIYDHLSINLAITYRVVDANTGDASVAMRIVPTRIDADGTVVTADDAAMGISVASLAGVDQDAAIAAATIKGAIETYLAAKGI